MRKDQRRLTGDCCAPGCCTPDCCTPGCCTPSGTGDCAERTGANKAAAACSPDSSSGAGGPVSAPSSSAIPGLRPAASFSGSLATVHLLPNLRGVTDGGVTDDR